MKISDFFQSGKVNNANLKTFARPLIVLLIIVFLWIFLARTAVTKISLQVSEFNKAKDEEALLATKLSNLRESSIGSLESANKLVVALPDNNSVMIMISQVKKLALEKNITFGKLEITGLAGDQNLTSIQLLTQIQTQDLNSLIEYLNTIPEMAPVSSINGVRVTNQGEGSFGGLVETTVYWAPFPTTIPSVREPVKSLTDEELKKIETISNLKSPDYQILDPSSPADRPEPFN